MTRKVTSIKINPKIWKKVRIHSIEQDKDTSDYLEEIIIKDLNLKKSDYEAN